MPFEHDPGYEGMNKEIAQRLKVEAGAKTVLRFCHGYVDDVPWSTQATYYPTWLVEEAPRLG